MAIKLYFDEVSHQGKHGQTKNADKVLYNLKLIGNNWFEAYTDMLSSENKATIFVPTGRFLSLISASLDQSEANMVTMDLLNHEEGAKMMSKRSYGNDELFMAAWNLIEYDKDFDKFELIAGDLPK